MWISRSINCLLLLIPLVLIPQPLRAQGLTDWFADLDTPWLRREPSDESKNNEEPLETDRDSFTPATTTVGVGKFLYESSYSFIDNRTTANDHSFPEIITRIGLTERVEFRLGWNYEIGGGGDVSNGDPGGQPEEPGSRRESQLLYGFKFALTDQRDWIPRTACIVQATTPTSGPDSSTDLQVAYVAGWKIFDSWQLDSSLRYVPTTEAGDHFNQWAPSVVLKVPVAEKWMVHGEYFGIWTDGKSTGSNRQYFSPGIHYLISPNVEVGIRVGWGLTQDAANFFSNVGFGVQF